MTTICAPAQLLADAARVQAARRALEPILERSADPPLATSAASELTSWLDSYCPPAAAALDRLRASDAAAPHPPRRCVRLRRTSPQHRPDEPDRELRQEMRST